MIKEMIVLPLFKNELYRYRAWIGGLATLHLLAWVGFHLLNPETQTRPTLIGNNTLATLTILASTLVGFLFGLLQMGMYKRINHWTYLIHRPLAPTRIHLSLAGAAGAAALCVFLLPWLVFTASLDLFTPTPVDLRHYLHGFYMVAIAYSAYQAGALTQLSPNRGAVLVFILVFLVIGHPPNLLNHASGEAYAFFILAAVVIGWLHLLNRAAFKPDLHTQPTSGVTVFLTALPMQWSLLFVVYFGVTLTYILSLQFHGQHPHQFPPEGTERHFRNMDVRTGILHLLDEWKQPEREHLKSQVELGELAYCGALKNGYSVRGQMFFQDKHGDMLSDADSESFWVFSHDEMLLHGTHTRTGVSLGWLGGAGFKDNAADFTDAERFPSVPNLTRAAGLPILHTRNVMYTVDFTERILSVKHRLPEGEHYYGHLHDHAEYVAVASDSNLHIFDPETFRDPAAPAQADYIMPHPRPIRFISHIYSVRLVDGYLLRYGNDYYHGAGRPGISLARVRLNGSHELLVEKEFTEFTDPAFTRYESMAVSPVLYGLYQNLVWRLIEPDERRHQRFSLGEVSLPTPLVLTILTLGLFCALITYRSADRYTWSPSGKWLWTMANAVTGVPGLISFFLLSNKKP